VTRRRTCFPSLRAKRSNPSRRKESIDCFVRFAPRNDVTDLGCHAAPTRDVILRESGVSSTPQLSGSITDVTEYWIARFRGRRRLGVLARSRTSNTASRPRDTMRPSCAFIFRAQGGRGECRMLVAPAASSAFCIGRTHTSNNEHTGITRHSRTQWFYGLSRALLGDRALLPPSSADMFCLSPVRPT
jgi:hypothetical protein